MSRRRSKWHWVTLPTLYAIHDRLIADHGGLPGIRDRNVIESAMARPEHIAAYSHPGPADLAAAYAFGLTRNHGFMDGNKRVAWTVARVFLLRNGRDLFFDSHEAIQTMEKIAAGKMTQDALATWLLERMQ
jgi:death-on-curing protein